MAGRLAAAAPDLKILVLEAGPGTKDDPAHIQPARFITHYVPTANTVRFHFSQPSDALGGRPLPVIAGQCLGGGSSINCGYTVVYFDLYSSAMFAVGMYTRASASDYDTWEKDYANPGWGFKDLLPLFNKVAFMFILSSQLILIHPCYVAGDIPSQTQRSESRYFRVSSASNLISLSLTLFRPSPLKVSYGGINTEIGKQFLATVDQVDPSRPADERRDATDFLELNVFNVSLLPAFKVLGNVDPSP